ncbi:MAG: DUF6491 family protein [Alphaproteobacteria bacterium]|nr:DUF6491 family protein [Alphaproteobacteria bacterium]
MKKLATKAFAFGAIAIGLAFAGTGPAHADAHEGEKASDKTVHCLDVNRIKRSKVKDNQTIILEMLGGDEYKMTLAHRCSGLKVRETWIHDARATNKLCTVDVIKVPLISSGGGVLSSPMTTCIIDTIVPYDEDAEKEMEEAEKAE